MCLWCAASLLAVMESLERAFLFLLKSFAKRGIRREEEEQLLALLGWVGPCRHWSTSWTWKIDLFSNLCWTRDGWLQHEEEECPCILLWGSTLSCPSFPPCVALERSISGPCLYPGATADLANDKPQASAWPSKYFLSGAGTGAPETMPVPVMNQGQVSYRQ